MFEDLDHRPADVDFEARFFRLVVLTVFIYVMLYAALFFALSAHLTAWLLLLSGLLFAPLVLFLDRRGHADWARFTYIIGCHFYLYCTVLGITRSLHIEYYYFVVLILPALLFDTRRKWQIGVGILLSPAAWLVRCFAPRPEMSSFWIPTEFPFEAVQVINFFGAAIIILILLKFFVDRFYNYNTQLTRHLQRERQILESSGLGVWDYWPLASVARFDESWCRMLGLSVSTVAPEYVTLEARIHPDDQELARRSLSDLLEGRISNFENIYRLRNESGTWMWILCRGAVSERDCNGRVLRVTGTHLDVTQLNDAKILLNTIQEMATIGGWEMDIKSQMGFWSEGTYRIHGVPVGTHVGKIDSVAFYAAEDRVRLLRCVEGAMHGTPYRDTFQFVDAAGVEKWVETMGEPVYDANGKIVRLRGTMQDITALVEAEARAKSERAKAAHNAKLASIGELATGIAHEINNPLAIIASAAAVMSLSESVSKQNHYTISAIQLASDRIVRIIEGLKMFARASNPGDHQNLSLSGVVRESLFFAEPRALQLGVSILFEAVSDAQVSCSGPELQQVIVNLVNNSIDAVKDRAEKWIRIELFAEKHFIGLRVQDSGPGIPPHIAQRLYHPFFTTKGIGQGTGLGLAIVKGILDDHRATIQLLSNEANTCFEIKFPKP